MKKVLGSVLFVIYAIIAITVTVLLLSYNEYNNSQLGGYTVYIVKDDSLEPQYKQGSILLIKSTSDKNVQIGDELFLYKVLNSQEYYLVADTLTEKNQQGSHIVYTVGEDQNYASDYFVGKTSDTVVIDGWGYILGLLESRWGYLFCVVIVSLLLFLQEVFELIMEIKYNKEKKKTTVDTEHNSKIVEEEPEEKVQARKTTAKSKTSETTKEIATAKPKATGTAKKTTSTTKAKSTGTAKKTTSTTKARTAGTTKKTTTRKTSATKPVKEEE